MWMSGNLVDLSQPGVALPDAIAVDTNVVIAYLRQPFPEELPQNVARATAFFGQIHENDLTCVLTPTVFSEVLHALVQKTYRRLTRGNRAALSASYGVQIDGWSDLLKVHPAPLQALEHDFTALRAGLIANGIAIIGQEDLDFVAYPPSAHSSQELIDRMVRYGMDSSDAVITMEASRLGIDAIVSMDRDMQRALPDFNIYTWL
jgi:predicted nucleic acid-binding protein